MSYFENYFGTSDLDANGQDEVKVLCPFPHNQNGVEYRETRPSAYYNINTKKFYCHTCKRGGGELWFVQEVSGCEDAVEASRMVKIANTNDTFPYEQYAENLKGSPYALDLLKRLGIDSVADKLRLGWKGDRITFPILYFGSCVDRRDYDPNPSEGQPKMLGQKGTGNFLFPYDLWMKTEGDTLLCAGEKDTAIAIARGFNAVTFTHGEGSYNKLFNASFKGKHVYICYDNDEAGRQGAKTVAVHLKEAGAFPHIVNIWESGVCQNPKEDLWDFFMKYNMSADDLRSLMKNTPIVADEDVIETKQKLYPLITLTEAVAGQYSQKLVSSRVVVMEEFGHAYRTPEVVTIKVYPKNEQEPPREVEWTVKDKPVDLLKVIETDDERQKGFFKKIAKADKNTNIHPIVQSLKAVFKYTIIDDGEVERVDESTLMTELTFYSFERLESGNRYIIYYYPVTNPKDQSVVGIIERVEQSDISVNSFKVTDEVKQRLKVFQGSPAIRLPQLWESAKHFTGVATPEDIFYASEMFYHCPLKFKLYGKTERAYLDILIMGDSRTGKSSTAIGMQQKYGLGTLISGKNATDKGLTGGSHGMGKDMKIRPGILPRNNKGAVILEEFSGMGAEFLSHLTEVRSSQKVRITRVSGHLQTDCWVRLLFISNQKTNRSGNTTPLAQYPNGIVPCKELLGADEDIARFDFIKLVAKQKVLISKNTSINAPEIDEQSYRDRIRWVWSRKEDQIVFEEQALEALEAWSQELFKQYDSQIQLFGVEVALKLARIAIACAGMLVSTDDEFFNIIVKPEHIAWARQWLVSCYDNDLFRFSQYVENEKKYERVDQACVKSVKNLWNSHPVLMEYLISGGDYDLITLQAISGLEKDQFNALINQMVRTFLIKPESNKMFRPSLRFRLASKSMMEQNYPVEGMNL